MSIQILPARLANQIAAGEVVERPASVIKELVENSLDAGATRIHIDVEKGGAKLIRIIDDGIGIVKDELTLALSRHATSKIHDLSDLEAIASLGFRGEALASISSVARLTLTSKPAEQDTAWQAYAQGRDMEVVLKPAAHPKGTTIEVSDLFFNTPARRKFLRTEKTEFSHIDEVLRRIALARFDVSFTLTHNGKLVRQYRAAKSENQYLKRVAQVCGQKFVDHAIEVECQHDGLKLWGWLAKPEYNRPVNDLCYSYVNGRMMRDKLINHGIRQAFEQLLPANTYPAFVLFLELNHKEVDVNVHPAKHEVRFHQGRYVHDFIYTVCHQALQQQLTVSSEQLTNELADDYVSQSMSPAYTGLKQTPANQQQDYIAPLRSTVEQGYGDVSSPTRQVAEGYSPTSYSANSAQNYGSTRVSKTAADNYQSLMSPIEVPEQVGFAAPTTTQAEICSLLHIVNEHFGLIVKDEELRLLNLKAIQQLIELNRIQSQWHSKLVSQPLLLPIALTLSPEQKTCLTNNVELFLQAGIHTHLLGNNKVQIRQFPAMLRNADVNSCFMNILEVLMTCSKVPTDQDMIAAVAANVSNKEINLESAKLLLIQAQQLLSDDFNQQLDLNSVAVDLTSELTQLN